MINVLFVGDIFGKPGRNLILKHINKIKNYYNIDFIIANGENTAGGAGLTAPIAHSLFEAGINAITLGNHMWDQKGFEQEIDNLPYVCRPANISKKSPGKPVLMIEHNGYRYAIFTVLGRIFMNKPCDCPFEAANRILEELSNQQYHAIIAEIHAETTSEKMALGRYLDGRVSLVVGTHTHVQTADATILPNETAYITDVGMTGPHDSIIGVSSSIIINQFLDGIPRRYEVAKNDVRLSACLATVNPKTKRTTFFKSIQLDEASIEKLGL